MWNHKAQHGIRKSSRPSTYDEVRTCEVRIGCRVNWTYRKSEEFPDRCRTLLVFLPLASSLLCQVCSLMFWIANSTLKSLGDSIEFLWSIWDFYDWIQVRLLVFPAVFLHLPGDTLARCPGFVLVCLPVTSSVCNALLFIISNSMNSFYFVVPLWHMKHLNIFFTWNSSVTDK